MMMDEEFSVNQVRSFIGKRVKLSVEENKEELFFTGVITKVEDNGTFHFTDKYELGGLFKVKKIVSLREAEK